MESYGEYKDKGITRTFKNVPKIIDNNWAYMIGYLACDGGYVVNRGFPFMMVNSTQEYIIRDFVSFLFDSNRSVYFIGKKSSEKVVATNDVWEVRFPPALSKQLTRFGIFCKKSDRRVVGVSKHVLLAYLAGCIDADGFISVTHRKDCRTPRLRWFLTHGSEKFIADLQHLLPINTTMRQHGDNVWRLQAQNTEQNIMFLRDVLPFLRNKQKINVLSNYLADYFVPQASGELLETLTGNQQPSRIDAEGSETR